MAIPPIATFMSEVRDGRHSVASASTSIWGGVDDPNVNELRKLRKFRKATNVLRHQLLAEYTRVKTLDTDEFDNEFPDVDELRFNYGNAIVRHMNLA